MKSTKVCKSVYSAATLVPQSIAVNTCDCYSHSAARITWLN